MYGISGAFFQNIVFPKHQRFNGTHMFLKLHIGQLCSFRSLGVHSVVLLLSYFVSSFFSFGFKACHFRVFRLTFPCQPRPIPKYFNPVMVIPTPFPYFLSILPEFLVLLFLPPVTEMLVLHKIH